MESVQAVSTQALKIEVMPDVTRANEFGRPLTSQERLILLGIFEGLDNREIAQHLGIAYSTLKNYLRSIYAKFGIHSTRGLFPLVIAGNFELRTGEKLPTQ